MGFAFRSDEVQIGDRVVARRAYAGGIKSDVIGHVLSLDPLVIRPQHVGGYPSNKEAVEITPEELQIIKKLSPRTIRNSDIRRVEAAIANAYPEPDQQWSSDGQWLMRATGSVPLGPSAGFSPVPVEDLLRHAGPRLLLPERIGNTALRHARPVGPELVCYVGDIGDISDADDNSDITVFEGAKDVLSTVEAEGSQSLAHGAAALGISDDEVVWVVSLQAPASAVQLRRRLGWGRAHHATRAVVVLTVEDTASRAIASECGLAEHHRRRFATL